ncbi:hypothetical protein MWU61_19085 [Loktanella sp. F6476L]|uniref:hypothetical protein n=1 Tax=Loktanella sp. F6476L TaxID=2926405 RepID=UPI001FF6F666|nr:hypothetical protein [Loktanella sp. F6476L]MCK0122661.1 hypothetical protein [Loktanella sp. F6476L]
MSKISLRFPYLIYLSIASVLIGVLIAPLFRDLPVQQTAVDMMAHDMQHGMLEVPAVGAPQIAIAVTKDPMNGWNVSVTTDNFRFTPEMVNSENVENTGHAHLYVDGIKIARLYGPNFHIPDLPAGDHEISVNLSSNDHSNFIVNGQRIVARTIITQG